MIELTCDFKERKVDYYKDCMDCPFNYVGEGWSLCGYGMSKEEIESMKRALKKAIGETVKLF